MSSGALRMTEVRDSAYELAQSAVSIQFDGLSGDVVSATLDALFDSLAVALAGIDAPGVVEARTAFLPWAGGRATVWGGFPPMAAPFAALLNAASLHALDYDDTDDDVPLHANSVVLPALIADVEEVAPGCAGREFLTSLAVGLDGAMRVGRAGIPRGSRGWNYSVVSGGIGATLALSRLRGFDVDTAVSALGHQLAQTSGSLQSIVDGSLAKRFQPAMAAKDVVVGVTLAAAQVDGPRNVFDGKAGLIELYQDGSYDHSILLGDLGGASLVPRLSLKPYPACRFTHGGIDAALALRERGVRYEDVARMRIVISGQAMNMVGRPFDYHTATVVDAQFSISYAATVALMCGGVAIRDFDRERVRDPRFGEFIADKVDLIVDNSIPHLAIAPVTVLVDLVDGRTFEHVCDQVSGSPQRRLTSEQLLAKAHDCLQSSASPVEAKDLWNAVHALVDDRPVAGLLELLKRSVTTGGVPK